ncbi:hypothetical protein ACLB3A_10160 [Corynebacterium freneyi]|uniref:hypothetical protein n=1 Tax=Corynebacterium freneyi TaxID=134034 RepID=UPI002550C36F|nr:hypothetical protein [Corynebacterium freneyi]MDK8768450.1 hypothetical protein [Corynebacterium freneyi]
MSTEKHVHENHDHEHGEGCGHVSFTHGDHTDYVHDGHIHRKVDGKWVECEPDGHVVAEDHGDHVHGPGCGHVAVPHGDHVDYIHDGHRHAAHGDHYDEH